MNIDDVSLIPLVKGEVKSFMKFLRDSLESEGLEEEEV